MVEARERARLEEEERERRAFEQTRKEEWSRRKEYMDSLDESLSNLPHAEVRRDGKKQRVQSTSFLSEISYAQTPRKNSVLSKYANFVVLDVETTGLSVVKDSVLEVAAIRVRDFQMVEVFHTLVKPSKEWQPLPEINDLTPEMVADAPALYEIIPSLQEFIANDTLLGHNLEFDLKFLCRAGLKVDEEHGRFLDTYVMAQSMLKKMKYKYDADFGGYAPDFEGNYDVENHKLETLCQYYGIDRFYPHRALGDCVDTARLLLRLVEERVEVFNALL